MRITQYNNNVLKVTLPIVRGLFAIFETIRYEQIVSCREFRMKKKKNLPPLFLNFIFFFPLLFIYNNVLRSD